MTDDMRRPIYYVLDGRTPVPCKGIAEWACRYEGNRVVRQTRIGSIWVSTVFIGIDHGFGQEAPLLFETMIVDGDDQSYQTRCSTWAQAIAQHEEALMIAKGRRNARGISPSSARIIDEVTRHVSAALRRLAGK